MKQKNNDDNKNKNALFLYIYEHKKLIILSIIFMILYSLTNPLQLWILKPFIDKMFVKDVIVEFQAPEKLIQKSQYIYSYFPNFLRDNSFTRFIKNALTKKYIFSQRQLFLLISIYIIGISLLKGFFKFLHNYLLLYITGAIIKKLRERLYDKLMNLPFNFYAQRKTGDILSRFTNDVALLQGTVSNLIIQVIEKPAEILFLTIFVFIISWKLSLVSFLILPLVAYIIYLSGILMRKYVKRIQLKISDITQQLQETIQGIKIIKSFTAEKIMLERFKTDNNNHFRQNLKSWRVQVISSPVIEFLTMLGIVLVLYFALYLVKTDDLTSGTIITFLAALMSMYKPIKELTQLNMNYHQIKIVFERINEILNIESDIKEVADPIEFTGLKKIITFNNVSFKYSSDDREILKNISFSVNVGKTAAIVGPSGVGKSTLVNLLPRFYDVTSGIISFDRVNIKNYSLETLRQQISIVEQEIFLFNDTIKNNICYPHSDCDFERVKECAKLANALEFIEQLPNGFDTIVGDRGQTLSVGQKQRIAIARAIYKQSSILILDEATSALDTESERLVQEAIDNLLKRYTTFVIAHRLSTVRNADLIIVLKDGEIVELGAHEQLLKKNEYYAQLYNTQFNK